MVSFQVVLDLSVTESQTVTSDYGKDCKKKIKGGGGGGGGGGVGW